ncbi:helix-turn-helix transcriptional regulator [Desulfosporosinus sp.]|uniref:helix-turn-helix domain-containing protein n=1 Tax=Desulfosporosinus sp. TaxID=157907 RepID=UPI002601884F|nr:helix-turn-helix transcriptional regulator [Desulfosporosinus sp.]
MDKEQVVTTSYESSRKDQTEQYYSAILSMMKSSGKDGYLKIDGSDVVFVETSDQEQDIKPLQFPLSAIRNYKGYTEDEAAKHCGVTTGKMKEFESDPGKMTASIAIKLRELYGIPIDYISM